MSENIEELVKRSFLARVPEIMERDGLDGNQIDIAIRKAYEEEEEFCLEMAVGLTERAKLARRVINDHVHRRLNNERRKS